MLDSWDDLRFVLAVVREGSLTAAARFLRVDQTTVTRRMKAIEEQQSTKLFDRLRGGVMLTPAGEAFAKAAAEVEQRLIDLDRTITGTNMELAGTVRLTLPHTFAMAWISPLTQFAREHPGLELELVVDDSLRNLTRREADVALRYAKSPPEHLVGRKLGRLALAVYGAPELRSIPVEELPWIGWEPDLKQSTTERFRQKYSPNSSYVLYATSMLVLIEAARRGHSVVVLSCLNGDADPRLVRLTEPEIGDNPLWLLTHPDLQRSPRVRTLMDYIARVVTAKRDALLGSAGPT